MKKLKNICLILFILLFAFISQPVAAQENSKDTPFFEVYKFDLKYFDTFYQYIMINGRLTKTIPYTTHYILVVFADETSSQKLYNTDEIKKLYKDTDNIPNLPSKNDLKIPQNIKLQLEIEEQEDFLWGLRNYGLENTFSAYEIVKNSMLVLNKLLDSGYKEEYSNIKGAYSDFYTYAKLFLIMKNNNSIKDEDIKNYLYKNPIVKINNKYYTNISEIDIDNIDKNAEIKIYNADVHASIVRLKNYECILDNLDEKNKKELENIVSSYGRFFVKINDEYYTDSSLVYLDSIDKDAKVKIYNKRIFKNIKNVQEYEYIISKIKENENHKKEFDKNFDLSGKSIKERNTLGKLFLLEKTKNLDVPYYANPILKVDDKYYTNILKVYLYEIDKNAKIEIYNKDVFKSVRKLKKYEKYKNTLDKTAFDDYQKYAKELVPMPLIKQNFETYELIKDKDYISQKGKTDILNSTQNLHPVSCLSLNPKYMQNKYAKVKKVINSSKYNDEEKTKEIMKSLSYERATLAEFKGDIGRRLWSVSLPIWYITLWPIAFVIEEHTSNMPKVQYKLW